MDFRELLWDNEPHDMHELDPGTLQCGTLIKCICNMYVRMLNCSGQISSLQVTYLSGYCTTVHIPVYCNIAIVPEMCCQFLLVLLQLCHIVLCSKLA